MTIKVKGILLKIGQTVHDERVLTVLTDRLGCISVFAKNRKGGGQLDQFYYGEWVLYQTGSGNYLLNIFCLEEPFHLIGGHLEHSFLAGYFAGLVLYFGRDQDPAVSALMPLLLNSLFLLGKEKNPLLVKSVFELKTMQLMGYCPTLSSCGHAGAAAFSLEDGSVLCADCAATRRTALASETVLTAVAYILNHPMQKAFGFSVPETDFRVLSTLCEQFVQYHLELKATALELWKTLYEDE